jgi:hypothetical protein
VTNKLNISKSGLEIMKALVVKIFSAMGARVTASMRICGRRDGSLLMRGKGPRHVSQNVGKV